MSRRSVPPVTGWKQPELPFIGSFPYNGTSGNVKGTASEDARRADDESGATTKRQLEVIVILRALGPRGATWAEVSNYTGHHHGTVSGALSALHKEKRIARLTERRNRCSIYVMPEYVEDRETQEQGRRPLSPPGTCPHCGNAL
jgi:hypothetical protein